MLKEDAGRYHYRDVRESENELIWTHGETSSRIRQETNTGDGTTWEKTQQMKIKQEMNVLCQYRHESYMDSIRLCP